MLRFGMLTSGGDCQALNAALRGGVKVVCTKRCAVVLKLYAQNGMMCKSMDLKTDTKV